MRQKEKELMRQHDLDLALDEIAPEAPEPVDSIALVFVDLQHWSKLWDVAINCMDDALQAVRCCSFSVCVLILIYFRYSTRLS